MFATRINYAWMGICLASIFICLKAEATPLATNTQLSPLKVTLSTDEYFEEGNKQHTSYVQKSIVSRSAEDDNTLDGEDNEKMTESPQTDSPGKILLESPYKHGFTAPLEPVKQLLDTVRERFHSNGGGPLGRIGAITNILGARHEAMIHDNPIDGENGRNMIDASSGLQFLEFFGTIFGLIWGFLTNLPALFGGGIGSGATEEASLEDMY